MSSEEKRLRAEIKQLLKEASSLTQLSRVLVSSSINRSN